MTSRNTDYFEFKLRDKSFLHLLLFGLKSGKKIHNIELMEIEKDSAVTLCTQDQKEVLIVIGGKGGVTIGGKGSIVEFGDLVYVPPKSVRSIANISNELLFIVALKYMTTQDLCDLNIF